MNEEYCMAITTISGREEAEELAEGILGNHLAACVQMTAVRSFFLWEGEVQREAEMLLLIKTTFARYGALESYISEYHPYDVPEIIRIPITGGLSGYLAWLSSTTSPSG
ncbi:divalent-cation tolerance protein CutA [Chlorobium limicola]